MGKTIHVVSTAAGAILKVSEDKQRCEAFIDGRAGEVQLVMKPMKTKEGDPCIFYEQAEADGPYGLMFVLTTMRLS